MNKKILSALLAVLLLLACFCISTAAVEEQNPIMILNCDTQQGSFSTNSAQKTEGRASYQLALKDEKFGFTTQARFSTTKDVSACDTLAMDVYLTDPHKVLSACSEFIIELTSSGTYDNGEIAFIIHGDLKGYAQGMMPGWNTLYFYFESVNYTANPDPVDLTKINFVRIFGNFVATEGLKEETMLIDNIRVCTTGGPSFGDMPGMEQFRGNNAGVSVEIDGMDVPDPDNRHNTVSINDGKTLSDAEKVTVTGNNLKQLSISVNPGSQPIGGGASFDTSDVGGVDDSKVTVDSSTGASSGMSLKLVVTICAAVLVLAVAVLALVVVVSKSKQKA